MKKPVQNFEEWNERLWDVIMRVADGADVSCETVIVWLDKVFEGAEKMGNSKELRRLIRGSEEKTV